MVNLAVITGGKAHDVIGFNKLFRSFEGINSYIQHLDDFAASPEQVRNNYDAVLFFFMMQEGPYDDDLPAYCGRPKAAIERLCQTDQGIIILHHALLAYPQWTVWNELVGIADRHLASYRHDEKLNIKVEHPRHPITEGISDWTMIDETYWMADAESDNRILLKTDHQESMETIAWVHEYKRSRVFCLQSGHDHQTWENENFNAILERGIKWSCP